MVVSMKTKRFVDTLIIHCAATTPEMNIGAKEIREWHLQRGWADIGYHYIIKRDGTVEKGRPLENIGAHVKGHNRGSIGVCLVGGVDTAGKPKNNFTAPQWLALDRMIDQFKKDYPNGKIHGHNEFEKNKACPSFDVQKYLAKIGQK